MTAPTTITAIDRLAGRHRLAIFGGFHPGADDNCPDGTGTLLLIGPSEPGFWAHVTAQPEWRDGAPDPIDRWSKRTLGEIAGVIGGRALFPSDGPRYWPFFQWALRTRRAWQSPVTLLVHDQAGLMVSFRGAITLPDKIVLPEGSADSPCASCPGQPCLSACPPRALTGKGYDLPDCHAFLDRPEGAGCLSSGCAVRRACPLSRGYGRLPEQSAYHMGKFHR
ncbi:MAG: ferredoxin [Rhodobacteraceae bacterium]|nr:ferredoxin [Paracoccaceae bacterium]